jgi:hypothetical protein
MSGASKRLPSWREAAEARGFGVLCVNDRHGERFTIAPVDRARSAEFAARGVRMGIAMTEAQLRDELANAGLSAVEIVAAIRLSRDWATTWTSGTN